MHTPHTEVVVSRNGAELARRTVASGEYVIGREPDCDFLMDTPLASRHHAKLIVNQDEWLIEDLASANGTFINDQPVAPHQTTRVLPTQTLRVGDATVTLRRVVDGIPVDTSVATAAALLPEEVRKHRYAIGPVVAAGGMGAILNARDQAIHRSVAMKVMLQNDDPANVARFVEEAQITGQLEHPNIVPVHELGVDEQNQFFYTMKLVQGITLQKVLDLISTKEAAAKKYPIGALLTIFQKVCDAIAFAHDKGVIHRDLKPENVMLGGFGEVLVMDWGIAKTLGSAPSVRAASQAPAVDAPTARHEALTVAGLILGTPEYMAPEQARGEGETMDHRADIYSLGAILYYILALRPPIRGDDPQEIVTKVARGEIDPLTSPSKARAIPDSLAAVCRKAMALDPAARYETVPALQAEIEAYQNGFATRAEKAGAWKQFTLLVKRNKAAAIVALVMVLLSFVFTGKVVTEGRRAELALADLRSAAPSLISQARELIDQQKFDEALAKIAFAVKIDGKNADYHLLQGQVLEATLQIDKADAEFRRVLKFGPNPSASANLELCERLLRENKDPADLDDPSLRALHDLMLQEQRTTQDAPIAARLGLNRTATDARIKALFDEWRKLPGWEKKTELARFHYEPDGSGYLDLSFLPINDLSVLKGIPLSSLFLQGTNVSDLSPLFGLHLVAFDARGGLISDLGPLKGMALKSIELTGCRKIDDLSALSGMPLEHIGLAQTAVTDFTPLAKCPIRELSLNETNITTLALLGGIPCERLIANGARGLSDISAVRSMRLKFADFANCSSLDDLSPLGDCPDLEQLSVPREAKNPAALRRLTKLRSITFGSDGRLSPEELWIKLGIADDHDRERLALIQKARAAIVASGFQRADESWVKALPDGTLDVIMAGAAGKTLAPLQDLPISALDLSSSSITDLAPVANTPLRKLDIRNTRISDLTPLAKCRELKNLRISSTPVRNLTPLAGLPLEALIAGGSNVADISILSGMPLRHVHLDHTPVTDLRPLLTCSTLRWLTIPTNAKDIAQLRSLKGLVRLSERYDLNFESPYARGGPAQTAEEFWKEFDARQPVGKK